MSSGNKKQQPPQKQMQPKIETVSALVEGAGFFESHGYSIIKITKDGREQLKKFPIKSTGVHEYQQELSAKAPRPPVIRQIVRKNSQEGRAIGLMHDQAMQVFDFTDEKYVDALDSHNADVIWRVTVFALDIEFKTKGGELAQTFEQKKAVLQSNGVTWNHVNKIYNDVQQLTEYNEEQEDFLSQSSSG